jgi:hypothetical protein
MSKQTLDSSNNCRTLYVILENGWGNIILELLAAYSLGDFILPEKCKVVGLLNSLIMSTHQSIYNSSHQQFGLPHPLDIPEILPRLKFETSQKVENLDIENLHEICPDWLRDWIHNRKDQALLMRADWMNINLELIVPRLLNLNRLFNNFRPSASISQYLNYKYSTVFSGKEIIGLHLRVRQPGDIMGHSRLPTAQWYADSLKRFDMRQVKELFVISGISTGHLEAKQYLEELEHEVKSQFPELKIIIVHDEPYYVDFFLLTHMPNLIITNSTFSVMAAILGRKWGTVKRVLVPSQAADLSPEIFKIDGFEEIPNDNFVCVFRGAC